MTQDLTCGRLLVALTAASIAQKTSDRKKAHRSAQPAFASETGIIVAIHLFSACKLSPCQQD
jgi:hypothetical protein